MVNKSVFTSGEVAKICSVSNPTAIKWIDSGKLKGFRIPGSRARRVTRKDLLAFMDKHDMPLERLEGTKTKVLVIDDEDNFCKALKREFDLDGSFEPLIVQNAFRAGAVLDEFKPEVILLDIFLGGIDGREVCKFLRQSTDLNSTTVIGMSGVYLQEAIMGHDSNGFDTFLKKPFKFIEFKEAIDRFRNKESAPIESIKRQDIEIKSEVGKEEEKINVGKESLN